MIEVFDVPANPKGSVLLQAGYREPYGFPFP